VLALALSIAVPLAWLVARTDLPGRRFWAVVGALPLVFPSYVAAFSIVAVLGPRGFVRSWLAPFGVERLPEIAYGYSGALLSLALFTYPYIYLPVVAALRAVDPALEESSRSLGVGRTRTFFRVVLPQLRAPICAGSLLVALYAVSDFGAVSIVRYNTLTLGIYNAYGATFDRSVAAGLSAVLVLLAFAFVLIQTVALSGNRPHRTRPTRAPETVALGRFKLPALVACSAVGLIGVAMPVGVFVFWAARALIVGNPLGSAWGPALNTVAVSALAAFLAVLLGAAPAAWSARYPGVASRWTERLSYSGNAADLRGGGPRSRTVARRGAA